MSFLNKLSPTHICVAVCIDEITKRLMIWPLPIVVKTCAFCCGVPMDIVFKVIKAMENLKLVTRFQFKPHTGESTSETVQYIQRVGEWNLENVIADLANLL